MDLTSRTDFVETWLAEMPEGLGKFSTFDMIEYNIKDSIKYGSIPVEIATGIKKITGQQVMYYWVENNNQILLGTELQIRPQGLIVSVTGKNPKYNGKPPYASDLYETILKDSEKSLRLFSDTVLSDEGYNIWKRLLKKGCEISVYDKLNPGNSFVTVHSQDQMDQYFGMDNTDFQRYQYVLSLNGEMLAETRSYFNTRRMRELTGLL